MNRFAALIDRLAYEPRRNAKIALMAAYFRETPDPDRGWALAALTGALSFAHAKAGLIRALIAERADPVLFALSYDFVGDLSETVALMWPTRSLSPPLRGEGGVRGGTTAEEEPDTAVVSFEYVGAAPHPDPLPASGERESALPLSAIVAALATAGKSDLPRLLAGWLDRLDETGRWALLKLITGALRIGVSARLARTAVASLGGREADEIEEVWHGLAAPYEPLFAWVEGRGPRPVTEDPAPFRPPMLAHPVEDGDLDGLDPAAYRAEWKWDGIRVQAVVGRLSSGVLVRRLYSRTGEDVSAAFPDLMERLTIPTAIDGELLVRRDGRIATFNELQQRLNRKQVTPKMLLSYPAHIRAYDLLAEGAEDLRPLPFAERRARLETFVAAHPALPMDVSPLVPFADWPALAAARADPLAAGAGEDAPAVEGLMIKAAASPYLPGRPKGHWWKWKRDPHLVDAVLMYAQRGHGKRSSFYSDYTFGVWRGEGAARELTPVGKAYFGFTDEELKELDRFVRQNTINRFGPVREVVHTATEGLVLEVAFEGLQESTRHKSGVAMRFPRVARIRWDKPPGEADELSTLRRLLANG